MSTEQLKMIIEMLSSLGAKGMEGFMWWLGIEYIFNPLLWFTFFLIIALMIYRLISRAMSGADNYEGYLMELRALTNSGEGILSKQEVVQTMDKLRAMIQFYKQNAPTYRQK